MKRILFGGLLFITLITTGISCCAGGKEPTAFTLQYWTVHTEREDIKTGLDAFLARYPYIKVEVRQFQPDEYEDRLIDAWAHGEGPDIFSIPNSHLIKFQSLITPLP